MTYDESRPFRYLVHGPKVAKEIELLLKKCDAARDDVMTAAFDVVDQTGPAGRLVTAVNKYRDLLADLKAAETGSEDK